MKIKNILLIALSTAALLSFYMSTKTSSKDKSKPAETHSFCDECCQY